MRRICLPACAGAYRVAALVAAGAVACAVALPLRAADLPAFLPLPDGAEVQGTREADYGEAEFNLGGAEPNIVRGRHWHVEFALPGLAGTSGKDTWAALLQALSAAGFTERWTLEGPFQGTASSAGDGRERWLHAWTEDPNFIALDAVEVAAAPAPPVFPQPSASPEPLSADADVSYLPPLPGSARIDAAAREEPLLVPASADAEVEEQVAPGHWHYSYAAPPRSSTLSLTEAFAGALRNAGWDIRLRRQDAYGADFRLVAQYARDGRNLWASIGGGHDAYTIDVADAGAGDLAALLAADCRAPLHGVLFDHDKATLQPASGPVLEAARAALAARADLAVEVQGHTDASGSDDYNLSLSSARAESVVAWLVAHGIDAARLAARGYGETRPVADNDSDAGRARNRRVELACAGG